MSSSNDAMFTQLTISVQGPRGGGKTQLSKQVLEPALSAIGATVNVKDERGAVHLKVALPKGALAPAATVGLMQKLGELLSGGGKHEPARFGDDVEVVDGVVRAKVAARGPVPSVPVNPSIMNEVSNLLQARALAAAVQGPGRHHSLKALPSFIDDAALREVIETGAERELARIDAALAAMGLRFEAEQ